MTAPGAPHSKVHEAGAGPGLSRRRLLRGGGTVAAAAIVAPFAAPSAAAQAPADLAGLAVEYLNLAEVGFEGIVLKLRELLREQQQSGTPANTVVHLIGEGRYPVDAEIPFQDLDNVHLVFEPGTTLFIDDPRFPRRPGMFFFRPNSNCSVRGGTFDANSQMQGSIGTGGSYIDCVFTNTAGENHPLLSVGLFNAEHVRGCSFELLTGCVNGARSVVDCTFSNLLDTVAADDATTTPAGGYFTLGVNTVIGNRTLAGQPTFRPGEVGGSVILTSPELLTVAPEQSEVDPNAVGLMHDVVVEDNYIYSPPGAFKDNTGVSGDVIALKAVENFSVQRNVIEGGGEFGLVISHGSTNGVIAHNIIDGTDGGGLVIGAQNTLSGPEGQHPRDHQTSPRVSNIEVRDNMIVNPGLDALNERRSTARPFKTAAANYANAISGIRVWNATGIRLERNVVNQYRSSGLWIKDSFGIEPTPLLEAFDLTERDLNDVQDLELSEDNVFIPYRTGESDLFDDETLATLDFAVADLEPWSGTSYVADIEGQKSEQVIGGIDASRIVSRSVEVAPQLQCVEPVLVAVTTSCLAGRGRIDVRVVNSASDTATFTVGVTGLAPRLVTVEPGEGRVVTVTGRPDGDYEVTVDRNGERIKTTSVRIECGAG